MDEMTFEASENFQGRQDTAVKGHKQKQGDGMLCATFKEQWIAHND